jgi:hypothetical protein
LKIYDDRQEYDRVDPIPLESAFAGNDWESFVTEAIVLIKLLRLKITDDGDLALASSIVADANKVLPPYCL